MSRPRQLPGLPRVPRTVGMRAATAVIAGGLLCGLAACGGGSSTTQTTSTSTSTSTANTSTSAAIATQTSNTSTAPVPVSTAPAQDGTADYCAATKNVTAQPPANLPSYPNAELHISQITQGNGLYAYCSSDSVSAIATYYAQQLPGKGWAQVQSNTISFLQQVTAVHGSSNLTISVEPSPTLSGVTEVLVIMMG